MLGYYNTTTEYSVYDQNDILVAKGHDKFAVYDEATKARPDQQLICRYLDRKGRMKSERVKTHNFAMGCL